MSKSWPKSVAKFKKWAEAQIAAANTHDWQNPTGLAAPSKRRSSKKRRKSRKRKKKRLQNEAS